MTTVSPAQPQRPAQPEQPAHTRNWKSRIFPVLLAILVPAAYGMGAKSPAASTLNAWERAVDLRKQLDATPAEQRTRDSYETVLAAFRAIYHGNPTAAKAPSAVAAVADLLAEKGRVLRDPKSLRAAIGQYEFLRQQYPNSPQVDNALLLEGEICRQDLKDAACAEEKFQAVIAGQSGTSFAEQAAIELKDLETGQIARPVAKSIARSGAGSASDSRAPQPSEQPALPGVDAGSRPAQTILPAPSDPAKSQPVSSSNTSRSAAKGRVVTITGMRHWSNPTSTRIAIDLGGKVEYEAARVPNPDRIFFDLHGARLAPGLNGRQVEVIDDGFLKRIRAAQFHPDVTRVVLDVSDVTEYSAFLLPNPWRLIIDIHSDKALAAANSQPNSNQPAPRSQKAPPSAPANTDSTIADVAGLSSEPAKITATAGPTSDPVSAQVSPQAASSAPTRAAGKPGSRISHTAPSVAPVAETAPEPARTLDARNDTGGPDTAPSASAKSGRKGKKASAVSGEVSEIPHAADPTADGQRSLVRALGLKVGRIVIDAGHGGHDSGTLGPGGIQEKDVVLDVALRVGKLLHQRLGAEIVYTRDDDTFIPLETRTAIANKAQADLFLSIHGNASPEPSARGVETYYLNFTSDPNALEVATRENAVSNHSVHQLSDLVRKITLKDKIDESREFAADVDAGLYAGLKGGNPGLRDRGVKQAPFVVLIGAQMPSVLAEISFLTNPDDADELRQGAYRQRIAESLDAGVERYLQGLSGLRSVDKNAGKRAAANLAQTAGPGSGR